MLFTEKYRPDELSSIVGNENCIREMEKWIQEYNKNDGKKDNMLLLSGPAGVSKTTTAHLLFKKYNYEIIEFNASDLRGKKLIDERLNIIIKRERNILSLKNIGIILDEIDGMSYGMSKLIMTLKIDKNETDRKNFYLPPIICICNNIDSNVQKLKRICKCIQFEKPSELDIIRVINNVIVAEEIDIVSERFEKILNTNTNANTNTNTDDIIETHPDIFYSHLSLLKYNDKKHIAQLSQGDFRRLINILGYVKENGLTQLHLFMKKRADVNVFDIVYTLYCKSMTVPKLLRYIEMDDFNKRIPLIIHENLYRTKLDKREKSKVLKHIINSQLFNTQPKIGRFLTTINLHCINQIMTNKNQLMFPYKNIYRGGS